MKSIVHSEAELHRAAQELLSAFPAARVFCFYGEMGAGKTTFIKVLCQTLGVEDVTSSPTFAIVNEYLTETGESIYHFDFYRIESLAEAYEIGVEDYLYSGSYCFIEWTEKIEPLVQPEFVKVSISVQENGDRWIIAE
ncbi:MAG: tRNA (adenosine(37)-N6)-threonylcarbamoyltransferase complex ATPase subunit type 1 TsaE [Bacteroidales bacterium]|nr:tRNA (adenosine(37)-N6)-threonylcarbamoyltransferase complex ATPase subunit type 1 TsaE [Bacteroidales bacterium]